MSEGKERIEGLAGPIEDLAPRIAAIRAEVGKILVGQRTMVDGLLIGLLSNGHLLLEGVPGLAKTTAIKALAWALDVRFSRIQFTPDLLPADVVGTEIYNPQDHSFSTRQGPIFANLVLADEINRAPAKVQAALLEAMQERHVTIGKETFHLPSPFLVLATQNPVEQEGTYPLPEAQLDRFLLKVLIDYPDQEDEVAIVEAVTSGMVGDKLDVSAVTPVMGPEEAVALQATVAGVTVDQRNVDYAVRIVRATRERRGIVLGAGPRGAIALIRGARAMAVLEGRNFVTPDDIKGIAKPALRHRIAIAPELEIEGQQADDALARILASVEAPRE